MLCIRRINLDECVVQLHLPTAFRTSSRLFTDRRLSTHQQTLPQRWPGWILVATAVLRLCLLQLLLLRPEVLSQLLRAPLQSMELRCLRQDRTETLARTCLLERPSLGQQSQARLAAQTHLGTSMHMHMQLTKAADISELAIPLLHAKLMDQPVLGV